MIRDAQGLILTAASMAVAPVWNDTLAGFVSQRADVARRVGAMLEADPSFALGHVLAGVLAMGSFNAANVAKARERAAEAVGLAAAASARERAHAEALRVWAEGEPGRAAGLWEGVLAEHPRDLLAFRLVHFLRFWQGRPDLMLHAVREAERAWEPAVPGWGTILACRCFALEECGQYPEAELAGRAAIALDPEDVWAAHGVAHVMEMQGRRAEGVAWVESLSGHWEGANNLRHHLWWHAALFHLERGATGRVLALYDSAFRDLGAALTRAAPDLYIDIQNAASMLFRLQALGVDVGGRWEELADHAEARIGDCEFAFTLPHWAMALAGAGRFAAAERLLEAMRAYGAGSGESAAVVRTASLPVSEAVVAHARGDHAGAVRAMRPALGVMHRMGGSHAQQGVFEQLFLHAAMRAGETDDALMLLERVAGCWAVPPWRRVGYAEAARALGFAPGEQGYQVKPC